MSVTQTVCAFVALVIQHTMRMRHFLIMPHSTVLFHIISQTARVSIKSYRT